MAYTDTNIFNDDMESSNSVDANRRKMCEKIELIEHVCLFCCVPVNVLREYIVNIIAMPMCACALNTHKKNNHTYKRLYIVSGNRLNE